MLLALCTILAQSDAVAIITQFCGASSQERLLIKSSVYKLSIFRKYKGFEKSQFYKINKELQCGDVVLKQSFQLLDQPLLCCKAVPTRHLQTLSSFSSSNDFTQ